MKKIVLLITVAIVTLSCKETAKEKKAMLPESNGTINSLSVVINEPLWKGSNGDKIRSIFAEPVLGLPQEEPLFDLKQYPTKIFNGLLQKSRNILVVKKSTKTLFLEKKNEFAIPQKIFYVFGKTENEINTLLEENATKIIRSIKSSEIKENQRRLNKSLISNQKIKDRFGITLNIGYGYKYDMIKDNFLWIRKEFSSGYNSILLYEVPASTIENNNETIQNIITVRDSIGKANIHGTLPNTWMITEKAYTPFLIPITLKGKSGFETRGTWELKNDFMAGPFVNYAIKNKKNDTYLIIEGFTYNPSKLKRNLLFELEAIIKSIRF